MLNKLTCKVQFHIAVWSLSTIRASSFSENFPQISAKLIAPTKSAVFTNCFSAKLASRIPAKSAVFSANLSLKIPRNLTFFPWPTRSPENRPPQYCHLQITCKSLDTGAEQCIITQYSQILSWLWPSLLTHDPWLDTQKSILMRIKDCELRTDWENSLTYKSRL